MKLTTINLLRGGVFSLAVVAAFAFTQPNPEGVLKGHLGDGVWEEIPEEAMYNCSTTSNVCTALFDENDQQIPDTETPGIYSRP